LRKLVASLWLFGHIGVHAQFYQLDNWSTSNSVLKNNSIRAMEIDVHGYIWLGTDWGLFRFDGIDQWEEWNISNSGIPSDEIRSITFDGDNNLWIGTFNHGLAHFDGENWHIYNVTNSDLPDNFVKYIRFDQNQSLWISTTGGLAKKSGDEWEIWNAYNSNLWTNNLTNILVDPQTNDKYVGSLNGGLSIFKNDTLHAVELSYTHGIPDNTIYGMAFKEPGQLWAAAPSGGIMIRFSAMLWQWYNAENSSFPSSSYNDIVIGNHTYLASQDAGFFIFDGMSFTVVSMFNSNLATNNISSLKLSADGETLWIATLSHGLYRAILPTLHTANWMTPEIRIFPNPFVEKLAIQGYSGQVEVFTMDGKTWLHTEVSESGAIDTSNWPSGVYLIQCESKTDKLIKP
jgi:ligand-binding sensor domain-containing protein